MANSMSNRICAIKLTSLCSFTQHCESPLFSGWVVFLWCCFFNVYIPSALLMRKAKVESQKENCDNYHSVLLLSEGTNWHKRFVRAFISFWIQYKAVVYCLPIILFLVFFLVLLCLDFVYFRRDVFFLKKILFTFCKVWGSLIQLLSKASQSGCPCYFGPALQKACLHLSLQTFTFYWGIKIKKLACSLSTSRYFHDFIKVHLSESSFIKTTFLLHKT